MGHRCYPAPPGNRIDGHRCGRSAAVPRRPGRCPVQFTVSQQALAGVVNGPGEAREADLGVAFPRGDQRGLESAEGGRELGVGRVLALGAHLDVVTRDGRRRGGCHGGAKHGAADRSPGGECDSDPPHSGRTTAADRDLWAASGRRSSGSQGSGDDQHQGAVRCSFLTINVRCGVDHLGAGQGPAKPA